MATHEQGSIVYLFEGLVKAILNTKLDLDGSGSPMKVFDANGDGSVGYRIYNIQKDPDDPLKLIYREVIIFGSDLFRNLRLTSTVFQLFTTGQFPYLVFLDSGPIQPCSWQLIHFCAWMISGERREDMSAMLKHTVTDNMGGA